MKKIERNKLEAYPMRLIVLTIGIILTILGMAEMIPAIVDWLNGNLYNAEVFLFNSVGAMFLGGALILANQGCEKTLRLREAFFLTTISWISLSFFSALPFYMSDLQPGFTDAFFEALSGITTTGSTVFSGLDEMSHGILLWRSMIQWIGGIGIVGFAIVFLPFLRVGGMQLFQTESSDRSEKVMPKTGTVITLIFVVYCAMTALCGITYYALGMNVFDALNHSLTTIPTGGYSTHDASFGYFESPSLELAATCFMFLGGVPFILYIKLIFQGKFSFFQDDQFKAFSLMVLIFIPIMGLWLWQQTGNSDSIRLAAFHIISIITTTGYTSTDYTLWGPFAVMAFFFITYIGASAGSTAGGLKTMRVIVAFKAFQQQISGLIFPHRVYVSKYQGKPLDQSIVSKVLGFLALYVAANVLLTIALALSGLDLITSISGAATALANVGPGIGEIIGPAGNFSALPAISKWLLCFGMLLGRLEIFTVVVLFSSAYWKN